MIYFETRKEYLKWNTGSSLLQLIDDSVEIILPSAAAKQYMQSMAGISEYEWKKTSTAFKVRMRHSRRECYIAPPQI